MSEPKLTKKQRKVLDFRGKKAKDADVPTKVEVGESEIAGVTKEQKGKRKVTEEGETGNDSVTKGAGKEKEKKRKKEKSKKNQLSSEEPATDAKPASASSSAAPGTKKRKRDENSTVREKSTRNKKRFDEDGILVEEPASTTDAKDEATAKADEKAKRFIIFVGNMSFKTTAEQISKHFAEHCTETPRVRLLTSKADAGKAQTLSKSKQKSIAKGKASDPGAAQSKGCAFVEFASREALQKALQFHHTQLHGRVINVELTAGGGGTGAERKEKIKKKNSELDEERKKLHEKYVKTGAVAKKASKEGEAKTDKLAPVEERKPQWGPNSVVKGGKPARPTGKVPRWAASGANAVRLSG